MNIVHCGVVYLVDRGDSEKGRNAVDADDSSGSVGNDDGLTDAQSCVTLPLDMNCGPPSPVFATAADTIMIPTLTQVLPPALPSLSTADHPAPHHHQQQPQHQLMQSTPVPLVQPRCQDADG